MTSDPKPAAASAPRPAWLEQLQRHVEDMRRVLYRDDTACGFDQASQAYQKTRPICCRDCQVNWFIRELADVLAACPPPAEARDLHDAFVEGWTAAGYMESALSVEECWDQSQTKRAAGRATGRPEGPHG